MATERTATQQLATLLLGQDVIEWVRERRKHKYSPKWQVIAEELREATDGQVDVSRETLRLWFEADNRSKPAEKAS